MNDFLQQVQAKLHLREGAEGIRRILLTIYRASHISLADLSFETTMPLPICAKVVNFLIEKEFLR